MSVLYKVVFMYNNILCITIVFKNSLKPKVYPRLLTMNITLDIIKHFNSFCKESLIRLVQLLHLLIYVSNMTVLKIVDTLKKGFLKCSSQPIFYLHHFPSFLIYCLFAQACNGYLFFEVKPVY